MRTKRLDTLLRNKMLSTVLNKRPLECVYFLKSSLILLREKTVAFVSVSRLLRPCGCTVPSNERNVCRVCLALRSYQEGCKDNRLVLPFFFPFQMNIKALFRTFCWFLKKQYAPCPDYRPVSNKHYPLAYQIVNKRPGRQIESLRYTL